MIPPHFPSTLWYVEILGALKDAIFLRMLHFRLGERPLWLDRERVLERPARRDEWRRPSHGSPGPEILICGIGLGGVPVVLSRALRHLSTGMRRSPWRNDIVSSCKYEMKAVMSQ